MKGGSTLVYYAIMETHKILKFMTVSFLIIFSRSRDIKCSNEITMTSQVIYRNLHIGYVTPSNETTRNFVCGYTPLNIA